MANYYDITLALAGVCQAAKLVQQLALNGDADQAALETSLNSLLQTAPNTTLDVFGGDVRHLKLGLTTLCEQLNGSHSIFTTFKHTKPHSCGLTGRHSFRRFVATSGRHQMASVVFP